MKNFFCACAAVLVCLAAYHRTEAEEAQPLAVPARGEPFSATLASVADGWTFYFAAGQETRRLAGPDLILWGTAPDVEQGSVVMLADGGMVAGVDPLLETGVIRIEGAEVVIETAAFGAVAVPRRSVRGVVFQLPATRPERDRLLFRALEFDGENDLVILENGDEIRGTAVSLGDQKLSLETIVGQQEIEIAKISGLLFGAGDLISVPPLTGPRALVGFRGGTLVTAASLTIAGSDIRAELIGGAVLRAAALEDLVYIQPLGHSARYISDRKPYAYKHVPYLTLTWPYFADRSVTGGRLRAGGQVYPKGLGMHSASRITYRLDRPYQRFDADLAIDEVAGRRGSVVFRVYINEERAWKEAFASDVIRGGAKPVPISVDVTGASALTLVVDYADRGDELDHANWLNPRLVP